MRPAGSTDGPAKQRGTGRRPDPLTARQRSDDAPEGSAGRSRPPADPPRRASIDGPAKRRDTAHRQNPLTAGRTGLAWPGRRTEGRPHRSRVVLPPHSSIRGTLRPTARSRVCFTATVLNARHTPSHQDRDKPRSGFQARPAHVIECPNAYRRPARHLPNFRGGAVVLTAQEDQVDERPTEPRPTAQGLRTGSDPTSHAKTGLLQRFGNTGTPNFEPAEIPGGSF